MAKEPKEKKPKDDKPKPETKGGGTGGPPCDPKIDPLCT